ncbi:MAG: hypothetical protein J0H17_09335 [Rhizobiales bacterium]|nr:hypothetical protein [Hyphomicrobiales bacterium]
MALIRPLREFFDDMGHVTPKQVLEVTDYKAADLVRRGLAVNVQMEAAEAKGPTSSPQTESRTGGETLPSSSGADQAPETSTSAPAEAAPDTSASTRAGGSRHGRTLSTRVTAPGGKPAAVLSTSPGSKSLMTRRHAGRSPVSSKST